MKKKIAVILAAIICCGLCLACGNNEIAGTYRTSFDDGAGRAKIYLILKKNGKFETYRLGEGETEDTLEEGLNLFPGTYSVKDGTITLKMKYHNPVLDKQVTEEFVGSVLSDGKIRIELFARSNLLVKQK